MFISKKKIVRVVTIIFLLFFVFAVWQSEIIGRIYYPFPYKSTVEKYAADNGVDPLLVIAVIREESRFIPKSKSSKGAVGLMQLMPDTANEIAVKLDGRSPEIDLSDPDTNIRYGTWYYAQLNKEFSGNTILALAAYNAGIGRVNSWLNESPKELNAYQIADIPYPETEEYVKKVLEAYGHYSRLYNN